MDFLTRIFLLWFTIYTLSVCPTDEKLQSPVCRGLHYYRQLVLEPFILPPIKLALSHPFVAPYVDRATPYANQLVSATKPIALRTKAEWNARVIPQWNKRIVPMWNTHVVSQWSRLAVPHITRLEHQFQPYQVRVVQEYERRLGPRLRLALFNMQKWQRQARPYFIFAVNKTYDGYQKTKPYAIPVLQRLKTQFSYLVRFLVAQRRQYVDPHVKKIWDRVIELSGGKSRPTTEVRVTTDRDSQPASPASSVERPTSLSSSLRGETDVFSSATPALPVLASRSLESFESASVTSKSISPQDTSHGGAEDTKLPTSSKDTASTATSSAPKPNSSAIPSVSDEYDLLSSSLPEYDNTVPSEPLISSSVDTFQAESASSAPSSIFSRASESIIDTVSAPSPSSTVALPSGSAHSSNAANRVSLDRESTAPLISPSASPSPYESDELDLDAFYAELGLGDDPLASTSSEGDESAPPIPTESEEDKAERIRLRQEQTAKKRADITGRHSLWESQLEERIVQNSKILRRTLVSMRKAAVSELKDSVEIRKEVESLVEEAEKYIKSAEKYLVSLRREPRKKEDKRALWTRVVERVDDKFGERLGQTEAVVNGWYNQILNKELEEVQFPCPPILFITF